MSCKQSKMAYCDIRNIHAVQLLARADVAPFDRIYACPQVYAPSRTVGVYGPAEWGDPEADQHTWGIPGLGIKDRGPNFAY
jgi:hypothetical protein